MKKHFASISADEKNSSFQLNLQTQFQKFTTKNSIEINRMKERDYVWGNDLCGSGGLLLGSGCRLASRSSLYSFECAPLAEVQWERASQEV